MLKPGWGSSELLVCHVWTLLLPLEWNVYPSFATTLLLYYYCSQKRALSRLALGS